MRVYVMTTDPDCPARWALGQEGVAHEVMVTAGDYGYGNHFADLWDQGEPFISVEHDVVPWIGAIDEMAGCPETRCGYGVGSTHQSPCFALLKVKPVGKAPELWRRTRWKALDMQVLALMDERLGPAIHFHEPAVAHCRVYA